MQYIKLSEDKWVEIDEVKDTSRVIIKSEVEHRIEDLTEQIEAKEILTDEQKLDWFYKNYPASQEQKDLAYSKQTLEKLVELLTKLK